jgi:hypothetical protein
MKTVTKVAYPKRLHIVALLANNIRPMPALVIVSSRAGVVDTYPIYPQMAGR